MNLLSTGDLVAFALFVAAWAIYHFTIERSGPQSRGLNGLINGYRVAWMLQMAERENRIPDTAIMNALQNGAAFFASSSLIAVGGTATLLRAADDVLRIFADLPVGVVATRGLWELKVLGLMTIFGYAFFKFTWSYRLFNYAAILIGATLPLSSPDAEERRRGALRAAAMTIAAARHFSRGQRAFLFALAYAGWFVGPVILVITTGATLYVMTARQFRSDARMAVTGNTNDIGSP